MIELKIDGGILRHWPADQAHQVVEDEVQSSGVSWRENTARRYVRDEDALLLRFDTTEDICRWRVWMRREGVEL